MFGTKRPHGEETRAMPETRKRGRFEIRSKLLLSVLAGITLMREPEIRQTENEDTVEEKEKVVVEEPERPVMLTMENKNISPITWELFESAFKKELENPIHPEEFANFKKKYDEVTKKIHNQYSVDSTMGRFKLYGVRHKVSTEEELRAFISEILDYTKNLQPEDKRFCKNMAVSTLLRSNSRVPVYEVKNIDELVVLAMGPTKLETIVEKYEFPSFPSIVNNKTLPRIKEIIFKSIEQAGDYSEVGLLPPLMIDRYISSLSFDPAEFPTTISPGQEKSALDVAVKLQDIGSYGNGIRKPDSADDIKMSFDLGEAYISTLSMVGYPSIALGNAKEINQVLESIDNLESYSSDDYDSQNIPHTLKRRYTETHMDKSIYGATVSESLKRFGMIRSEIEKEKKERGKGTLASWEDDLLSEQFMVFHRKQMVFEGAIDEKAFKKLLSYVTRQDVSSKNNDKTVGRDPWGENKDRLLEYRFDNELFRNVSFPAEVQLSKDEISSASRTVAGRSLLRALDVSMLGNGTVIMLSGYDVKIDSEERYEEYSKDIKVLFNAFNNNSYGNDSFVPGFHFPTAVVHLPKQWAHPTTADDIIALSRIIRKSNGASQHFLNDLMISQIDMSDYPSFPINDILRGPLDYSLPATLGERIFERADFSNAPLDATPKTLSEVHLLFKNISWRFGTPCAERYLRALRFPEFPSVLNDATILEVSTALNLLENSIGKMAGHIYAGTFKGADFAFQYAPIITDLNLELELSKQKVAEYGLGHAEMKQKPDIQVTLPAPQNMRELMSAMVKLGMVRQLDEEKADIMQEEMIGKMRWDTFAQNAEFENIKGIEKMRLMLNEVAEGTQGDRIVVMIGTNNIDKKPVTWENLDEKVLFAKMYLRADHAADLSDDVYGLYRMIGFFQVSQILEFFNTEGKDEQKNRITKTLEQLRDAGAEIDTEDSVLSKVARSWKTPGYILQKAVRKLEISDNILRAEWKGLEVRTTKESHKLKTGYRFAEITDAQGNELARVVLGEPAKGAKIDYVVMVGGGLTEEEVQGMYPEGKVVAEAVGAYTTGAQKPAELAFDNGHAQNLLVSDREGVVIISKDGAMRILHRDAITRGDIDGTADSVPLRFRSRLADFSWLLKNARTNHIDLMAGHLLVDGGELSVADNSSSVKDKRRALATFNDGSFGLVDFSEAVTFFEEAVILQKMGAVGAVNLDTGYYDHANVYTKDGERIMLGEQDQDGTNNKFVFLTP